MTTKTILIQILACSCIPLEYLKELFNQGITALSDAKFDQTILVQFSTVLAGFISITVPVALSIVSRHTEDYKDKEISESFLKEWCYKYQIFAIPFLVISALLLFGLKVDHGWPVYSIIALDVISFMVFVYFLTVVGQYATNFDTYYSNKLKKDADEIVHGKK
ncbi:MAG: hypothetical protein K0S09_1470 [Sphingobacteriaceae bacterium]|jgi:hypothetical protein|nr:hypothetical protein [Sphingobacteriaceae bacterium]